MFNVAQYATVIAPKTNLSDHRIVKFAHLGNCSSCISNWLRQIATVPGLT